MQIEVFCTPEEFVGFVKEAAQAIGANIYATADRTQPLKQIEPEKSQEVLILGNIPPGAIRVVP